MTTLYTYCPIGLLFLHVEMMSGKKMFLVLILFLFGLEGYTQKYRIVSGGTGWKATSKYSIGWNKIWFDDSGWGVPSKSGYAGPAGLNRPPGTDTMWVSPYSDTAYFRWSFELKSNCVKSEWQGINGARLSVDDNYELYVNGTLVGQGLRPRPISVLINPYLRIGKNVIAIKATNNGGPYFLAFGVDISYITGPEIVLDPDKYICEGDSAYFGPKDHYQSYKWSNGQTTRTMMEKKAGKYWLTAKDTALCDWVDTVELFTYSHKDVVIGPNQTICTGERAVFDAGKGYTTYKWSSGDTTDTISVNYSGKFWVSVTDANGCFSSDSAMVETFDNATVSLGEDTILCKGDSMLLVATFPLSVYKWDDGSTDTFRLVTEEGVYSVTITNHCGSVSDNINVDYITTIDVDLGPDDFFCFNQKYELKAEAFGADKYEWSTGDTVWKILVEEPGTYTVRVEDKCGNVAYDEKELTKGLKQHLMVPNSFSPNQDGLNETWKPIIRTIGDYSLKVIDRWGKLVFETTDVNGEWDGTVDGKPALSGNYIYRISLVDCEYQTEVYTGRLTIVR